MKKPNRCLHDIVIACQRQEEVSKDELILALLTSYYINQSLEKECNGLMLLIEKDRPTSILKGKASFIKDTIKMLEQGKRTPVDKWLGPKYIPGTTDNQKLMEFGENLIKKVGA